MSDLPLTCSHEIKKRERETFNSVGLDEPRKISFFRFLFAFAHRNNMFIAFAAVCFFTGF
jgi:hypothetical protein